MLLITFPRSGSHFFIDYIHQSLNIKFIKKNIKKEILPYQSSHELYFNKDREIITIIRDPLDSIASMVSMEHNFFPEYPIKKFINKRIKEYIEYYQYFNSQASYIIDYKTLIEDPDSVASFFSKILNVKQRRISYIDNTLDRPDRNHVKTSRQLKHYDKIRELVANSNLDECYLIYSKLLDKKSI